jgi:hypothetical protein
MISQFSWLSLISNLKQNFAFDISNESLNPELKLVFQLSFKKT